MEIKGPGPPKPPAVTPPAERTTDQTARTGFSQIRKSGETAPAGETSVSGPAKVRAEFRRSDLTDPVKADRMVKLSVNELVGSDPSASKLSGPQRQKLAEWMEQDPVLRGKILNYLEKVLD
jgi:hypothetical protein